MELETIRRAEHQPAAQFTKSATIPSGKFPTKNTMKLDWKAIAFTALVAIVAVGVFVKYAPAKIKGILGY